jgi:hypothetical protein
MLQQALKGHVIEYMETIQIILNTYTNNNNTHRNVINVIQVFVGNQSIQSHDSEVPVNKSMNEYKIMTNIHRNACKMPINKSKKYLICRPVYSYA